MAHLVAKSRSRFARNKAFDCPALLFGSVDTQCLDRQRSTALERRPSLLSSEPIRAGAQFAGRSLRSHCAINAQNPEPLEFIGVMSCVNWPGQITFVGPSRFLLIATQSHRAEIATSKASPGSTGPATSRCDLVNDPFRSAVLSSEGQKRTISVVKAVSRADPDTVARQ